MTESVWDYPRPPRVEATDKRIRVVLGGVTIVDSTRALRVLETSHPPVYYVPMSDVEIGTLHPHPSRTFCEYKGEATYFRVSGGAKRVDAAAWSYPKPSRRYESLIDHVAFYPSLMDACFVDAEQAKPQEGDFYGGWVTADVVGPFKGGPGTRQW